MRNDSCGLVTEPQGTETSSQNTVCIAEMKRLMVFVSDIVVCSESDTKYM